ncbi:hypothetical protein [Streptomyces sp. NPDC059909]|uniref:hypothetical protein n=1 Tax=Streptomyces sp. NPDC059909 TaxID=3346998 RepID=UPI00365B8E15
MKNPKTTMGPPVHLAIPPEPPSPAQGCGVCAALAMQRQEARDRGDYSTATDASVDSVVGRSGRRVLRVLFTDSPEAPDLCAAMRDAIDSADLMSEWNGERHVAIDVADDSVMSRVFNTGEAAVRKGLAFWEWSDARKFQA